MVLNTNKIYAWNQFPRVSDFCNFCDRPSVMEGATGHFFCPNAHIVVLNNSKLDEIQPKSIGNPTGVNVYKLANSFGKLCNSQGIPIEGD
jgi:hypothetical protein